MTRALATAIATALLWIAAADPALGQEPAADHAGHEMPEHPPEHEMAMPSLFEAREVSGTAWAPDVSPMYGVHRDLGAWQLMLHGNGFVQFLYEASPEHRGGRQAGSINWAMAMAGRQVGPGRLGLRTMVSLEPWTIGGCGYPNLLATGELCDGDSIHDRQHPHDLFMEIAARWDQPLARGLRWELYGGLAGEPALGPPGFPHRLSAMPNPISPMAHHWLDATHITFGVVTAGVYTDRWKVEASAFNGREPDEHRTDLDLAPLDSVAARVWLMPRETLALQVSGGYLRDAEQEFPSAAPHDAAKLTASATYHRRVGSDRVLAATLAWGANRELGELTFGWLAEWSATFTARHTAFGRLELNGKPAHDLHIHESTDVFMVGKVQAGYTRYFGARHGLEPGIGASVSAGFVPPALRPRYGGVGIGVGIFGTVRAAAHTVA